MYRPILRALFPCRTRERRRSRVADLLQTTRIGGSTLSPDGNYIAYIGNASGRLNLWVMNVDGTGARQLLQSNDRQAAPAFTHDGKEIVYMQDKGGDELYDLYSVPTAGGEPRNITNTDHTSEVGPHFSPDGNVLAFGSKDKATAYTNVAVMAWPAGAIRLLTHESDPQASWSISCWSPDGKSIYAVREVGREDSDVYRINVSSGKAENLTAHKGKELVSTSDVSPDSKTLLLSSNRKGGYDNVALFDLTSKQWRWVTDTQWTARPGEFSPDGKTFTYGINADGRTTIFFADTATLKAGDRGVPPGINNVAASPTSFTSDGSYLLSHEDSTHPANLYMLHPGGELKQITHNESPALASAALPGSQLVTYKSFDGRLISAFVWIPFNLKRDGTAAAVVMPHGGPTGQTLDTFNSRAMLLASRGFVVIAPNVRGSTGYGMEFQKANYKDLGGAGLEGRDCRRRLPQGDGLHRREEGRHLGRVLRRLHDPDGHRKTRPSGRLQSMSTASSTGTRCFNTKIRSCRSMRRVCLAILRKIARFMKPPLR